MTTDKTALKIVLPDGGTMALPGPVRRDTGKTIEVIEVFHESANLVIPAKALPLFDPLARAAAKTGTGKANRNPVATKTDGLG
jgi:hypothetical protein